MVNHVELLYMMDGHHDRHDREWIENNIMGGTSYERIFFYKRLIFLLRSKKSYGFAMFSMFLMISSWFLRNRVKIICLFLKYTMKSSHQPIILFSLRSFMRHFKAKTLQTDLVSSQKWPIYFTLKPPLPKLKGGILCVISSLKTKEELQG
jgi:hypothetical protein